MPEYMVLLYAPEVDEAERAERWAEMPLWDEVNAALREAGVLVKHGALHGVAAARTVRVRGEEAELTDGPFAVTKEVLVGYYLLECADVDRAVEHASTLPVARYGSVEVRPVLAGDEIPRPDRSSSAS
ncbi:MAG TPA: YciI family protein [Solirubrobacteraceae bacterium]|nr:YciI family protein [Solirubrobacteraceae bacterium]